ncbi:MAG: metallopeptidase family protein [Alphaproteobacteria bacterium]|nr:metallopeptidase family protein [Alphaproteobacteria bacterium]
MSDGEPFGRAPSLDNLAAMAEAAFAALPEAFRRMTGQVIFRIDDFAAEDVLDDLGIEDPFELTGLYQGVDLTHRSMFDPVPQPSMVFLYRRPILDEWAAHGEITLEELVSHVLVHEIGHHFGLSDAQIDAIEAS